MGDHVSTEQIVGTEQAAGHSVNVVRLTWHNHPCLSFDLYDADDGTLYTEDGSYDEYPGLEQIAEDVTRVREAADKRQAQRRDARAVWDAIQRGELPEDPRLAASDFYDLLAEYEQTP